MLVVFVFLKNVYKAEEPVHSVQFTVRNRIKPALNMPQKYIYI
jgi:hypothetical protein